MALLALLSIPALAADRTAHVTQRPDEIVIMVDDLGAIDNRILDRLPNIKALFLKQGLQFDKTYSETPLCCPGRASFLTGQHTAHHGVVVNDARLLDPSHTIATALHDDGYYTMMAGKYLNGAPLLADHMPPGWDHVAMLNDWSTSQSSDWWVDDLPAVAGYFDRYIDQTATAWLAQAPADKPLFMWIAPHAPHKSASSTKDWEPDIESQYMGDPRCAGIKPWRPPNYAVPNLPAGYPLDDICRSMLTVDDMVGHLRDAAAAEGRNPVWVLMSDNGMAWGADGYLLKNVPQADGLPYYMTGPGIDHGKTDALISNIDIGPTLADLAGTTMPKADGKSFVKALDGHSSARKALLEDHPVGGPTGEGDVASGPWWGVRTPRWHLVVWNGVSLYDTVADPWEMDNVAGEHMDVVVQLADIFNRPIAIEPSPSPTLPPTSTPPTSPPPTDAQTAQPTDQPTNSPSPTASPSGSPYATEGAGQSVVPSSVPSRSPHPRTAPSASPAPDAASGAVGGDDSSRTSGNIDLGPALLIGLVALLVAVGVIVLRPRL